MNKKCFETVENYPRRYKRHLPNVSKIVNCNTLLDMDRYSNTKNLHKFLEKYKHSHLFHALPIAKVKAKKKKFSRKTFHLAKWQQQASFGGSSPILTLPYVTDWK